MFTWLKRIERGQGGLVGWDAQCWLGQCDYVHAAQQDRPIRTCANLVETNDKHYCFTKVAEVLHCLKSMPLSNHLSTVSQGFS